MADPTDIKNEETASEYRVNAKAAGSVNRSDASVSDDRSDALVGNRSDTAGHSNKAETADTGGSIYSSEMKELKAQGSPLFPIAIYEGNLNEEAVPLHWHDEFELGVVTGGSVVLYVGTERRVLRCGDGFFINAGSLHAFDSGSLEQSTQRSIVFLPALVGGRIDSIFWQKYCQPLLSASEAVHFQIFEKEISWQSDIIDAICRAWHCCHIMQSEYELDVRHILSHVLHSIGSHVDTAVEKPSRKKMRENERIKLMIRYINNNYNLDIDIDSVAESAMISHTECLRCFHDIIGITPARYLRDVRVRKAAELLLSSNAHIADIAELCGFQDTSYFIRVFREAKGCTPADYRTRSF